MGQDRKAYIEPVDSVPFMNIIFLLMQPGKEEGLHSFLSLLLGSCSEPHPWELSQWDVWRIFPVSPQKCAGREEQRVLGGRRLEELELSIEIPSAALGGGEWHSYAS